MVIHYIKGTTMSASGTQELPNSSHNFVRCMHVRGLDISPHKNSGACYLGKNSRDPVISGMLIYFHDFFIWLLPQIKKSIA